MKFLPSLFLFQFGFASVMYRMQRNVFFLLLLFCCSTPGVADSEPTYPEGTSASEAYHFLRKAVQTSRDQKGFHLNVNYDMTAPSEQNSGTIISKGVFRQPGDFRLKTDTLSGMNVKSFGQGDTIAHINPSTHRINTSEQLGITSVDRTLLDPFRHFDLLLKPNYEGFSCSFDGEETIDEKTHRVVKVTPGPKQIQDVMNKFKEKFQRPVKPENTDATYRIFVDPESKLIRRIKIQARSQMKSQDHPGDSSEQNSKNNGKLGKEKLEGKTDTDEEKNSGNSPVTMKLNGEFNLTKYNNELSFEIPEDVKKKLTKWSSNQ